MPDIDADEYAKFKSGFDGASGVDLSKFTSGPSADDLKKLKKSAADYLLGGAKGRASSALNAPMAGNGGSMAGGNGYQ